jgi:hypothetical protein
VVRDVDGKEVGGDALGGEAGGGLLAGVRFTRAHQYGYAGAADLAGDFKANTFVGPGN